MPAGPPPAMQQRTTLAALATAPMLECPGAGTRNPERTPAI